VVGPQLAATIVVLTGRFRLSKREAAACIGIASAVGAYGGFLVPRGFAMSTSHFGSLIPALYIFCGFYVVCLAVTYFCYLRKGGPLSRERV